MEVGRVLALAHRKVLQVLAERHDRLLGLQAQVRTGTVRVGDSAVLQRRAQ